MTVARELWEVQAAKGSVRFRLLGDGGNPANSEKVDMVGDLGVLVTAQPYPGYWYHRSAKNPTEPSQLRIKSTESLRCFRPSTRPT